METPMKKSIPSLFGKVTSTIFDEYPLYKCEISSEIINNYLPDKIDAFNEKSMKNFAKRELFYSKPIIFVSRSQLSDQSEELSDSIKLDDLLEELLSKTNQIQRYNFVITGNNLIFIEISHASHLTYHLLCKHITLSNRSDDVRFAGEFWLDQNNIYYLNNASGTYRPSNYLIENTVQLFKNLSPRLNFKGISYQINSRPSFRYRLYFKIENKKTKYLRK